MAAVLLEPGTRLVHIGPHKTGTTAIQGALHLARERLAAEGVVYPGRGRQPLWPILAVTGQPSPDEPRIETPGWALARAAEISAEMAKNVEALGVNIVGDLATLGESPEAWPDPGAEVSPGPPMVPVEVAARAAVGAFLAGGASGQTAEEIVRELDARSLAKVLAGRCRQRVRRAFAPAGPQ